MSPTPSPTPTAPDPAPGPGGHAGPGVIELRRYRLAPGGLAPLARLFREHFTAPHRELGMELLGPFHHIDPSDRIVWIRDFDSLATRAGALGAFYGGPVWETHGEDAISRIEDYSDVHLLRRADPARPWPGTDLRRLAGTAGTGIAEAGTADGDDAADVLVVTVQPVHPEMLGGVIDALAATTPATPGERGLLDVWRTEPAENDFPALPVRTDRAVAVTVERLDPTTARERAAGTGDGGPAAGPWHPLGDRAWRAGTPEVEILLPAGDDDQT